MAGKSNQGRRSPKAATRKSQTRAGIVKSPAAPAPGDIFMLKITLQGSDPPIWRRFAVPADVRLDRLHDVIQTVMGWTDSHLHQFVVYHLLPRPYPRAPKTYECDNYIPRPPADVDEYWKEPTDRWTDECTLNKILKQPGQTVAYEYDMGDSWEHIIELEKIISASSPNAPVLPKGKRALPAVCIEGKLACPPEDCGGMYRFYGLLEIMRNPQHEEHEDRVDWLGEVFDESVFDLDAVNKALRGSRV